MSPWPWPTFTRVLVIGALALTCACATRDAVPETRPPDLPWPARLEDLTWLEGRWAGVDEHGTCHLEHWLAPAHGAMWVVRAADDRVTLERVTLADLGARSDRTAVVHGARYVRSGDRLVRGAVVLRPAAGLSSSCPRP